MAHHFELVALWLYAVRGEVVVLEKVLAHFAKLAGAGTVVGQRLGTGLDLVQGRVDLLSRSVSSDGKIPHRALTHSERVGQLAEAGLETSDVIINRATLFGGKFYYKIFATKKTV